ncbi:uncharacterized protein ARMOST_17474 [Armillaria ostoyae]|uniref:Uncharacterized protein n=1 Tax=Armillaria ostoyae TaxID=47428 RepID=A0A284RZ37_ARMOS|nr:uncharacterized protein ARMOST_17474 [Armillaria ostoyae]
MCRTNQAYTNLFTVTRFGSILKKARPPEKITRTATMIGTSWTCDDSVPVFPSRRNINVVSHCDESSITLDLSDCFF